MSTTQPAGFHISFDVTDLDASEKFYQELGQFRAHKVDRPGEIFETRHLSSTTYPGVQISIRGCFGKRATGTSPGAVTGFGLPVHSVADAAMRLSGKVRWVGPAPDGDLSNTASIDLLDPDGYQIQLYRTDGQSSIH